MIGACTDLAVQRAGKECRYESVRVKFLNCLPPLDNRDALVTDLCRVSAIAACVLVSGVRQCFVFS